MSKLFKRIAILLVIALVAPTVFNFIPSINNITVQEASAATAKAKIVTKNVKVGINSTPEYIYIENYNEDAVYKYATADKKIASVTKYGSIDGVAKGKTNITVSQSIKGKTTKIGTIAVSVVAPELLSKTIEAGVNREIMMPICYMNNKATYTYTSSDKKIVTVDNKHGLVKSMKEGKATISITEKYKGKTTKIGSVTITVVGSSIESKSVTIGINSSNNFFDIFEIRNYIWDASYTVEATDSTIVTGGYETSSYGDKYFMIKGVGLGKTTLTVYEEFNGVKRTVGTVDATVIEIPITTFEIYSDYIDEETGVFSRTYYVGEDYSYSSLKEYMNIDPYDTTSLITYTSSDENVVKVDSNGYVTPVGVGSAEITITCGSFSVKMNAEVLGYE